MSCVAIAAALCGAATDARDDSLQDLVAQVDLLNQKIEQVEQRQRVAPSAAPEAPSVPIIRPVSRQGHASERTMKQATDQDPEAPRFELRFWSLFRPGTGYAFPCDVDGHVDLDALSEAGRNHYFFARAMVGAELSMPTVGRAFAS